MTTKQQIIELYATARVRSLDDAPGICPRCVYEALDTMDDHEGHIYNLAIWLCTGHYHYLTLSEIQVMIRAHIDQTVKDLIKIKSIYNLDIK